MTMARLGFAFLATASAALGQGFSTTHIPTVPRSVGGVVSDDNRWLYTLSANNVVVVTDLTTNQYTRLIDLSGQAVNPSGIAFCHGKLFVESYSNILVIDPQLDSIQVVTQPFIPGQNGGAVVTTGDCDVVYAVSGSTDTLSILNPYSGTRIGRVNVGRNNTDMALSIDASRAYLINELAAMLTIVDLTTRQVVDTVDVTGGRPFLNLPMAVAVRSDGLVYVSWTDLRYMSHVAVIDSGGGIVQVFDVPGYSAGLALSVDESLLFLGGGFVLDSNDGSMDPFQAATTSGNAKVTFAPGGKRAFITNENLLYIVAVDGFPPMLTVEERPSADGMVTLSLVAPRQAGRPYQIGASYGAIAPYGTGVGRALGEGLIFPLDQDPLFTFSLDFTLVDPFANFYGRLGADGRATATVRLTGPIPGAASGRVLFLSCGTFAGERRDVMTVERISNVVSVTINR